MTVNAVSLPIEVLTCQATLGLSLLVLALSFIALNNKRVYLAVMLHPSSVYPGKQWYRVVSSGFVHVRFQQLFINCALLLIYGSRLESFLSKSENTAHIEVTAIFVISIVASNLISVLIHRKDFFYSSAGSSAGVLAMMISYLLYNPGEMLVNVPGIGGISNWLIVPAYIAGLLYLTLKKSHEQVSHELHLLGSLAGVLITVTLHPIFFSHLL